MDIYYFTSPDKKPESPDEWESWNLVFPLKGRKPKIGEDVFVLNFGRKVVITEITVQDDISEWPFNFTTWMMHYVIEMIFKGVARL